MLFSDMLEQSVDDTDNFDQSVDDIENVEQSAEADEIEIDQFLHKIRASGVLCPIMAMREPYARLFVEKRAEEILMQIPVDEDEYNISVINLFLVSKYNRAYEELSLEDLQQIASDITLSYSEEEIEYIENKTRDQSSSKLWYRFRAGRVTASIFKRVF